MNESHCINATQAMYCSVDLQILFPQTTIQRGCVLVTGYHCYIHADNVLGLRATPMRAMYTVLRWRFVIGSHHWQGLTWWRSRVTLLLLSSLTFDSGPFENCDTIIALVKHAVLCMHSTFTVRELHQFFTFLNIQVHCTTSILHTASIHEVSFPIP